MISVTWELAMPSSLIELDFIEPEATPKPLMQLGIQLHLGGLSFSNTISVLGMFGIKRCRSTVHKWVQKADLQPVDGRISDHVAVDETVIQLNNQRFWLYTAVDPQTNEILHVRLFPTRTQALTERFLAELQEKHDVADAVFLVDSAPWLLAVLHRHGPRFQTETHGK